MAEERVERRLAAILCADVVGYSRLMGADEEKTLADLKNHRRELIDPLIDQHRGRIFKTTGDGILIEFASVVDAVRCAVVVQQGMEDRNANLPASERIRFRIGINLGDVMVDEGDMFGDGVNVAARLQQLAAPGEICVSASMREQVGEKLPIGFADLGEHGVKNIARPVRVYRVEKHAEPRPAAADDRTRVPLAFPEDRPSVAVLPFNNMSADAEQEYFVDGIVEDIITGLSRIRWLHVIARNSTFTYKGRAVDIKQVGRELGARYVLEGSLRKAGNRIRITAQLIEAGNGTHVWAERYDRALDDIFELQDEITLSLVGAIEPSLRQTEIERAKRKRPENLDAYDLYLRALPHAYVPMPGEADKALVLLGEALALQPDYPAAQAAAAWCYEMRYLRGGLHDADKVAALGHAQAAIEAGADDAATLATAGFVIGLVAHDYQTAIEVIDRALTLTGASALALWMGATVLAHAGEVAKAIDYAERALRLTPFGRESSFAYVALAMAYSASGNFEQAVATSVKSAQANPRFSVSHVLHAAALSRLGRLDEAGAAARRVLECEPDFTVSGFVRAHTGRQEIWGPIGDALRPLGLPE
jgi:TolB-like protein/class 3 adenylate cyclase/Tfp pilus assembly protein PilF